MSFRSKLHGKAPVLDASLLQILEFPSDDHHWRLDGLGGISHPGSSRSEPLIDVYLSQMVASDDSAGKLRISGRGVVRQVKVGLISLLKHGSLWLNGTRQLPGTRTLLSVDFDPGLTKLLPFNSDFGTPGFDESGMNLHKVRMSHESAKGLMNSPVVLIRRPAEGVEFMAIPSSVVFQKCQATSSKAVRHLMWGQLHKIVDNAHWVEIAGEPRTFCFEVFKDFSSIEATSHANLHADRVGQREYLRLRNSLMIGNANADRGRHLAQPYIQFGFPFSNPVHLDVVGNFIHLGVKANGRPRWGYLVTEILRLKVQYVFDRFVAVRKNSNEQGQNSDDVGLKDAWSSPKKPSASIDENSTLPVDSGSDPIDQLEAFCVQEAGGIDASGAVQVRSEKLLQQYRRRIAAKTEGKFDGTASTGDVRSGATGAAELDVDASEIHREPVTLTDFFSTIALLRGKGFRFETLATSSSHRILPSGDVVNYLPRVIPGLRSWHLIHDHDQTRPRGYVLAVIQYAGTWHHFIEIERKTDKFSLAHIRTEGGTRIEAQSIRAFMNRVAISYGWKDRDLLPQWSINRIPHDIVLGIKPFAKAIALAIGFSPPKGMFD